jgi:capsular polysaccharide transport system permease protein
LGHGHGMRTALGNQFRVLGVLIRRDLDEKLSRGGIVFLFSILEPAMQICLITTWFVLMRLSAPYGTSSALFAATGFIPYYIFVHLSLRFRSSFVAGMARRRLPMETSLDLMMAQSFMHLVFYSITAIGLFGIIFAYDTPMAWPQNWTYVLKAVAALIMLGFGMGLCNPVISFVIPIWPSVYPVVARVLIFLSSILFVADFLPVHVRNWVAWNPLMHAVSMFRMGFYPGYPSLIFSEAYLWGVALVILTLGLCLQRIFRQALSA